jgi:hypothetical protein
MFVLVATLIADSMIKTGADSISQELASNWGVALFIVIAAIYLAGQYFILGFVKQRTKQIRARYLSLKNMYNIVAIIQYSLTAILIIVILPNR